MIGTIFLHVAGLVAGLALFVLSDRWRVDRGRLWLFIPYVVGAMVALTCAVSLLLTLACGVSPTGCL